MSGNAPYKHLSRLTLGQMMQLCDPKLRRIPKEILEEGMLRHFFGDKVIPAKERLLKRAIDLFCEDPCGKNSAEHLRKAAGYLALTDDKDRISRTISRIVDAVQKTDNEDKEAAAMNAANGMVFIASFMKKEFRHETISMMRRQLVLPKPSATIRDKMLEILKSTKIDLDSEERTNKIIFDIVDPTRNELVEGIIPLSKSLEVKMLAWARIDEMDSKVREKKIEEFEATTRKIVSTAELFRSSMQADQECPADKASLVFSPEWRESFLKAMEGKPDSPQGDRMLKQMLDGAIGAEFSVERMRESFLLLEEALGLTTQRGERTIALTMAALFLRTEGDLKNEWTGRLEAAFSSRKGLIRIFTSLKDLSDFDGLYIAVYQILSDNDLKAVDEVWRTLKSLRPEEKSLESFTWHYKVMESNILLRIEKRAGRVDVHALGHSAIEVITENPDGAQDDFANARKTSPSSVCVKDREEGAKSRYFIYLPFSENRADEISRRYSQEIIKGKVAKLYARVAYSFAGLPCSRREDVIEQIGKLAPSQLQPLLERFRMDPWAMDAPELLGKVAEIVSAMDTWDRQMALDAIASIIGSFGKTGDGAEGIGAQNAARGLVDIIWLMDMEIRPDAISFIQKELPEHSKCIRDEFFRMLEISEGESGLDYERVLLLFELAQPKGEELTRLIEQDAREDVRQLAEEWQKKIPYMAIDDLFRRLEDDPAAIVAGGQLLAEIAEGMSFMDTPDSEFVAQSISRLGQLTTMVPEDAQEDARQAVMEAFIRIAAYSNEHMRGYVIEEMAMAVTEYDLKPTLLAFISGSFYDSGESRTYTDIAFELAQPDEGELSRLSTSSKSEHVKLIALMELERQGEEKLRLFEGVVTKIADEASVFQSMSATYDSGVIFLKGTSITDSKWRTMFMENMKAPLSQSHEAMLKRLLCDTIASHSAESMEYSIELLTDALGETSPEGEKKIALVCSAILSEADGMDKDRIMQQYVIPAFAGRREAIGDLLREVKDERLHGIVLDIASANLSAEEAQELTNKEENAIGQEVHATSRSTVYVINAMDYSRHLLSISKNEGGFSVRVIGGMALEVVTKDQEEIKRAEEYMHARFRGKYGFRAMCDHANGNGMRFFVFHELPDEEGDALSRGYMDRVDAEKLGDLFLKLEARLKTRQPRSFDSAKEIIESMAARDFALWKDDMICAMKERPDCEDAKRMLGELVQHAASSPERLGQMLPVIVEALKETDDAGKKNITLACADIWIRIESHEEKERAAQLIGPILADQDHVKPIISLLCSMNDKARFNALYGIVRKHIGKDERNIITRVRERRKKMEMERWKETQRQSSAARPIDDSIENAILQHVEQQEDDRTGYRQLYDSLTGTEKSFVEYVLKAAGIKAEEGAGQVKAFKELGQAHIDILLLNCICWQLRNPNWRDLTIGAQRAADGIYSKFGLMKSGPEAMRKAYLEESPGTPVLFKGSPIVRNEAELRKKISEASDIVSLAAFTSAQRRADGKAYVPKRLSAIIGQDEAAESAKAMKMKDPDFFERLESKGIDLSLEAIRGFAASARMARELSSALGNELRRVESVTPDNQFIMSEPAEDKGRMADSGFSYGIRYSDGKKMRISAVFDGVSGQNDSVEASAITKEIFELGIYSGLINDITDAQVFCEIADIALGMMNFKDDPQNMRGHRATTIALTMEYDGNLHALHAGDSRWRVFRKGKMIEGSADHTILRDALEKSRSVFDPEADPEPKNDAFEALVLALNEEDAWFLLNHMAENSPQLHELLEHVLWNYKIKKEAGPSYVTSCIGSALGEIDISTVKLEPGDVVALYTDGISDVVCGHRLAEEFLGKEPAEAIRSIMEFAKSRSGPSDRDEKQYPCGCIVRKKKDDRIMVAYMYGSPAQEETPGVKTLLGLMPEGRMK